MLIFLYFEYLIAFFDKNKSKKIEENTKANKKKEKRNFNLQKRGVNEKNKTKMQVLSREKSLWIQYEEIAPN